ncbi:MAG: hypothetical protein OEV22_20060, partial [Deltaproteobacteria bacterium]|nr:hypothetical protein [Deltaproteobacteria bacterium]
MKKKSLVMVGILIAVLLTAIPALADAPAAGTVYEGDSVPGVALGETRAQVDEAYGHPASCTYSTSATCSYNAEGGGKVNVTFRAPDGGPAQNSPDDVVTLIGWEPGVTGWVTTAGIDITIAREDPQAVIDAYPNADVTYWYDGTFVSRVIDWELGILVDRYWVFYCGCTGATMAIFNPQEPPPPPPPPDPLTRVTGVSMYDNKIKGERTVWAYVWVDDEYWADVVGATVVVDWTHPNGNTERLQAFTTEDAGVARFEMNKVKSGTHSIEVVDVVYPGHPFDRDYGVLAS